MSLRNITQTIIYINLNSLKLSYKYHFEVQLLPFQVQEVKLPSTTVKVVLQWLLKENPEVPPYAGV